MRFADTYIDIIEDKVSEWNDKIKVLSNQKKEQAHLQSQYNAQVNRLRAAIETATIQLHELNEIEKPENTVKIKNKILNIFESIDQKLTIPEKTNPFML